MRILRAISIGILLWVLIFVEFSITMFGFAFSQFVVYGIHYVLLIPIVWLCAWLYYKSKEKFNGFVLGIIFVLIGTVLDLLITVPMFVKDFGVYYSSLYLWIGFAETIIIVGLYDLFRKK